MENNMLEGLTVFSLPKAHRKRMRTSNGIEWTIQQELKRGTSKARAFTNLNALEHLATAVPVEIDENGKLKPRHTSNEKNSMINTSMTIYRHQVA